MLGLFNHFDVCFVVVVVVVVVVLLLIKIIANYLAYIGLQT